MHELERDDSNATCGVRATGESGARAVGIESNFLVEKRHGYQYEHCFSQDWNAMRGYHFLMRLGHLINILAQNTEQLAKLVVRMGV